MSDDLVARVAAILDEPCGCPPAMVWDSRGVITTPLGAHTKLRDCPVCLPKRVAAFGERCVELCGQPDLNYTDVPFVALAALKGDECSPSV